MHLSLEARKVLLEVYQQIADSRSWDKTPADVHFLLNPDAFRQVMMEHAERKQRELASVAIASGEAGLLVSDFAPGFAVGFRLTEFGLSATLKSTIISSEAYVASVYKFEMLRL